jgi:hypothetical protein
MFISLLKEEGAWTIDETEELVRQIRKYTKSGGKIDWPAVSTSIVKKTPGVRLDHESSANLVCPVNYSAPTPKRLQHAIFAFTGSDRCVEALN